MLAFIAAADTVVAQAGSVYLTFHPRGKGFCVLYRSIIGDGVPSDIRCPIHDRMMDTISSRFVIIIANLLTYSHPVDKLMVAPLRHDNCLHNKISWQNIM
jgi:hypothetical protein